MSNDEVNDILSDNMWNKISSFRDQNKCINNWYQQTTTLNKSIQSSFSNRNSMIPNRKYELWWNNFLFKYHIGNSFSIMSVTEPDD